MAEEELPVSSFVRGLSAPSSGSSGISSNSNEPFVYNAQGYRLDEQGNKIYAPGVVPPKTTVFESGGEVSGTITIRSAGTAAEPPPAPETAPAESKPFFPGAPSKITMSERQYQALQDIYGVMGEGRLLPSYEEKAAYIKSKYGREYTPAELEQAELLESQALYGGSKGKVTITSQPASTPSAQPANYFKSSQEEFEEVIGVKLKAVEERNADGFTTTVLGVDRRYSSAGDETATFGALALGQAGSPGTKTFAVWDEQKKRFEYVTITAPTGTMFADAGLLHEKLVLTSDYQNVAGGMPAANAQDIYNRWKAMTSTTTIEYAQSELDQNIYYRILKPAQDIDKAFTVNVGSVGDYDIQLRAARLPPAIAAVAALPVLGVSGAALFISGVAATGSFKILKEVFEDKTIVPASSGELVLGGVWALALGKIGLGIQRYKAARAMERQGGLDPKLLEVQMDSRVVGQDNWLKVSQEIQITELKTGASIQTRAFSSGQFTGFPKAEAGEIAGMGDLSGLIKIPGRGWEGFQSVAFSTKTIQPNLGLSVNTLAALDQIPLIEFGEPAAAGSIFINEYGMRTAKLQTIDFGLPASKAISGITPFAGAAETSAGSTIFFKGGSREIPNKAFADMIFPDYARVSVDFTRFEEVGAGLFSGTIKGRTAYVDVNWVPKLARPAMPTNLPPVEDMGVIIGGAEVGAGKGTSAIQLVGQNIQIAMPTGLLSSLSKALETQIITTKAENAMAGMAGLIGFGAAGVAETTLTRNQERQQMKAGDITIIIPRQDIISREVVIPHQQEILNPKEVQVTMPREAELVIPRMATDIRTPQLPDQPQVIISKVPEIEIPRQAELTVPAQITTEITIPRVPEVEIPKIPDNPTPYVPWEPPPTVPPYLDWKLPEFDLKIFGKEAKGVNAFKYNPNLEAALEHINSLKMPDIETGANLRPIIVSRRKKKKGKK